MSAPRKRFSQKKQPTASAELALNCASTPSDLQALACFQERLMKYSYPARWTFHFTSTLIHLHEDGDF